MRKTVLYLVILAVLGTATFFFFHNESFDFFGKNGAFDPSVPKFNIKDTGSIGKLFLVSTDGQHITVERTDSGWVVDKKYRALPSTLNLLLETIAVQEALYPVTKNAAEI